ncbi:MAG TPA: bifunctional UDP-N-acetylglucosamine diphosphorylase/glucosamine-1-phosphate N-acetyltransferase GlmU [Candidatus Dormibacteraeota bacterium]|nr:bifunctional UDP-N-acetylglucosamine diphosphorylase/glucosamine-1-phosphate N-acetyltransferase GlmU [Candidatus Dormibacteraeota bacterium]
MRVNASAGSRRAHSSETRGGVTVVVLAAGKGVRMNSRIPKVLHPVAGRPMLLWAMAAARAIDPARTLVVTNPDQDGVQAAVNGHGETVPQREQLGTGHALAQVATQHRTAGPVVVLYADAPLLRGETLERLLAEHKKSGAAVSILTAELDDPRGYGRIVRARNGVFREIVEEKDATREQREIREVNSGVYCFSGRELWPALAKLENKNRAGEYYLTDVVRLIKGKVHTVRVDDPAEVLGINDRRQLAQAERVMRHRILDQLMLDGVTITDPDTTYIDPDVRIGRDSVIHPFTTITGASAIGDDCVIGPMSQLRDSTIGDGSRIERAHLERARVDTNVTVGPFSRLRPGTELQEGVRVGTHTEIKNSKIGPGSAVPHFSYLGDAVVGANVNIGAGSITANWDGFEKHETQIGDRAYISCDTIFVAPVRIGSDATTAADSVITKDVPAGSLAIARPELKIVESYTERRRARHRPPARPSVPREGADLEGRK